MCEDRLEALAREATVKFERGVQDFDLAKIVKSETKRAGSAEDEMLAADMVARAARRAAPAAEDAAAATTAATTAGSRKEQTEALRRLYVADMATMVDR